MSKRSADTDINHDNWDAPFEPEKPGVFKAASEETLQKRVIRTAKRRIKPSENSDSGGKNIFASFGGFKPAGQTTTTAGDAKPSFGFLGTMVSSSATPTTNGSTTASKVTSNSSSETNAQQTYLANLKQLNKSVSDWIKQHVDTNPLCILSPVFKDYENHLKKIQEERDNTKKSDATSSSVPPVVSTFSFVSSAKSSSNTFAINIPTTSAESSTKSTFQKEESIFSSSVEGTGKSPLAQDKDKKPAAPSIFGTFKSTTGSSLLTKPDPAALMVNPFLSKTSAETKPFTFSNGTTAPTSSVTASSTKESNDNEDEEESDEPPKVEFTPVQEEGSVYSTRCKVFVKKDGNYAEKGVGTLFIKKVGEDKHQLLVRAETVIGTVLVNTLLSAGIPAQRMGKNNVMLVCVPTPQEQPPPTTVLLRVKSADEADQLLSTIQQYKAE